MDTRAALELRLRLLETLVFARSPGPSEPRSGPSIARRAEDVVRALQTALDGSGSEAIKRFISSFEANEALLKPPLPVSAAAQANALPPTVKAALVLEAEQDVRNLERDLRELETLDQRGISGTGPLKVAETLLPDLRQLQTELAPVAETYLSLEDRVAVLLGRYNDYVNSVSSIFVDWNAVISRAEEHVTRIEKQRAAL